MKPFDDTGTEIDANFSVEEASGAFDVVLESRGGSTGGRPPRNAEYAVALELLIRRLGGLDAVLQDLLIASSVAEQRPEPDRRIAPEGRPLPMKLSSVTDPHEFRLAVGREAAAWGRPAGGSGGNATKRLRLRITLPDERTLTADHLGRLIAHPPMWTEHPTADPEELRERATRTTARLRSFPTLPAPPPGSHSVAETSSPARRFVRDPNVIAWVLASAAGICEVCGEAAPFTATDGRPYLEVHHVRPLAEKGPDTTDNAVACCPNCHRELHHGKDRDRVKQRLISSVARLLDY